MNLTPEQWALVQPLLPPPPSSGRLGRPALDQRLVLEGILHKLATRTPWLTACGCSSEYVWDALE